jgi:hydrogenase maturation protease
LAGDALVIGYGNELRGDDGAGPRVARAVQGWGLPGVRALALHQLTPELAEDLAGARVAVFVDAAADADPAGPRRLSPGGGNALGHICDPGTLLALARGLFGRSPPAWLITVPARSFAPGEGLSETARAGVRRALPEVARLTRGGASTGPTGETGPKG